MQNSHNKVLVTGANSFLGYYLCNELLKDDYSVLGTCFKNCNKNIINDDDIAYVHCNLLCTEDVYEVINNYKPKYVFHLAGFNGGIKFNLERPYEIFSYNTTIANNLFNAITYYKPEKVISIVASCAYNSDKHLLEPKDILEGKPHESVACHGYAKRHLQLLTEYSNKQFGINAITACCTTLYGPRDSIDPNRTKVMMALIKKFVDAKKNNTDVEIWGTGQARRQFIFAKDAAICLKRLISEYNNSSEPVQISYDTDISVRNLCELIAKLNGFNGEIRFDTTKPDGQLRKELSRSSLFNDIQFTELHNGIKETIKWYQQIV
jgi:GDP-L-fucose synthase